MVPAGEFIRGSPEGEGEPHERPQRRIAVSEYLIDKTEVTWRQYRRYVEATGKPLLPEPIWGYLEDYPASNVLWDEAASYCEWAGGRLPTEAEWEKAARGAEGMTYPWGGAWEPGRCNLFEGGPHRPESAGQYRACHSPYGALDMAGSVWEWCADWYGQDYYAGAPERDPEGPESGMLKVLRGGAWNVQRGWVRGAHRHKGLPTSRNVTHGFRCAQDATE
jgi:formylglycine-generating enzyme required for sulfatase activity